MHGSWRGRIAAFYVRKLVHSNTARRPAEPLIHAEPACIPTYLPREMQTQPRHPPSWLDPSRTHACDTRPSGIFAKLSLHTPQEPMSPRTPRLSHHAAQRSTAGATAAIHTSVSGLRGRQLIFLLILVMTPFFRIFGQEPTSNYLLVPPSELPTEATLA